ncbi:MAG: hypothetical protein LBO66_13945 [Deltaproteobacteria bacterium]|jgi:hypothetical protein|nr:hypothetical protein [Deltaproteobacteria bacterium]
MARPRQIPARKRRFLALALALTVGLLGAACSKDPEDSFRSFSLFLDATLGAQNWESSEHYYDPHRDALIVYGLELNLAPAWRQNATEPVVKWAAENLEGVVRIESLRVSGLPSPEKTRAILSLGDWLRRDEEILAQKVEIDGLSLALRNEMAAASVMVRALSAEKLALQKAGADNLPGAEGFLSSLMADKASLKYLQAKISLEAFVYFEPAQGIFSLGSAEAENFNYGGLLTPHDGFLRNLLGFTASSLSFNDARLAVAQSDDSGLLSLSLAEAALTDSHGIAQGATASYRGLDYSLRYQNAQGEDAREAMTVGSFAATDFNASERLLAHLNQAIADFAMWPNAESELPRFGLSELVFWPVSFKTVQIDDWLVENSHYLSYGASSLTAEAQGESTLFGSHSLAIRDLSLRKSPFDYGDDYWEFWDFLGYGDLLFNARASLARDATSGAAVLKIDQFESPELFSLTGSVSFGGLAEPLQKALANAPDDEGFLAALRDSALSLTDLSLTYQDRSFAKTYIQKIADDDGQSYDDALLDAVTGVEDAILKELNLDDSSNLTDFMDALYVYLRDLGALEISARPASTLTASEAVKLLDSDPLSFWKKLNVAISTSKNPDVSLTFAK